MIRYVTVMILVCFLIASHMKTASLLLSFILFMVLHPEVQRRTHEEMDRVVGRNRLPIWEDRKDLPFFDAVITEVARMRPPINTCEYVSSPAGYKIIETSQYTALQHKTMYTTGISFLRTLLSS